MLFGRSINTKLWVLLRVYYSRAEENVMRHLPAGLNSSTGSAAKTAERLLKGAIYADGPSQVTEFATHSYVCLKYPGRTQPEPASRRPSYTPTQRTLCVSLGTSHQITEPLTLLPTSPKRPVHRVMFSSLQLRPYPHKFH
jgi:hypothetical protein